MTDNNTNHNAQQAAEKQKEKLHPMTVRFSDEVYNIIQNLSNEYHISKADIVRIAIDGKLERYLGIIRYIDEDQGKMINKNIIHFGNILVDIRNQMRRIGINYNNELKLKHLQKKKAIAAENKRRAINDKISSQSIMKFSEEEYKIESEIKKIKNETSGLNVDELKILTKRIEDVIQKAGDILCTLV